MDSDVIYSINTWRLFELGAHLIRFDFIECFTITFLHTHSWLNWVDEDDDEDEVGVKEKPEDTRYINKRPLGLTAPLSNNTLSIIHSPMTLI